MPHSDLCEEVRKFQSGSLKRVATTVTASDGQQYEETLLSDGYAVRRSGVGMGYVIDNQADITVSHVLEGLILGSQDVAAELRILEDFDVTHILNVAYQVPNHFEYKFIYKNVEILDDPSTNIKVFFDSCFEFIDDARQEGCVLVHCNAGLSRAPTIVIAYLIKKYRMTLDEAMNLVKSVRASVRPNDGFMKTLQEFEKEVLSQ